MLPNIMRDLVSANNNPLQHPIVFHIEARCSMRLHQFIIAVNIVFLMSTAAFSQSMWNAQRGLWSQPTNWSAGVPNSCPPPPFQNELFHGVIDDQPDNISTVIVDRVEGCPSVRIDEGDSLLLNIESNGAATFTNIENMGTVSVDGANSSFFLNGAFDNSHGLVEAVNASSFQLESSIHGGRLHAVSDSTIDILGRFGRVSHVSNTTFDSDDSSRITVLGAVVLEDVANHGTLALRSTAGNGDFQFTLRGFMNNRGVIEVDRLLPVGDNSIQFAETVALSGGGQVVVSNSAFGAQGPTTPDTVNGRLVNEDNTITIENGSLHQFQTNHGRVLANGNNTRIESPSDMQLSNSGEIIAVSGSLDFGLGAISNTGLIEARNSGTILIETQFHNAQDGVMRSHPGGRIIIRDTSTEWPDAQFDNFDSESGRLFGGHWIVDGRGTASGIIMPESRIVENASSIVLRGAAASFPSLASLQSIANIGVLELTDSATIATQGSLDNAGILQIGHGSSVEVIGTFRQHSGTIAVDGDLKVLDRFEMRGGALLGSGTIWDSERDLSYVDAVVSPGLDGVGTLAFENPVNFGDNFVYEFQVDDATTDLLSFGANANFVLHGLFGETATVNVSSIGASPQDGDLILMKWAQQVVPSDVEWNLSLPIGWQSEALEFRQLEDGSSMLVLPNVQVPEPDGRMLVLFAFGIVPVLDHASLPGCDARLTLARRTDVLLLLRRQPCWRPGKSGRRLESAGAGPDRYRLSHQRLRHRGLCCNGPNRTSGIAELSLGHIPRKSVQRPFYYRAIGVSLPNQAHTLRFQTIRQKLITSPRLVVVLLSFQRPVLPSRNCRLTPPQHLVSINLGCLVLTHSWSLKMDFYLTAASSTFVTTATIRRPRCRSMAKSG